MEFFTIAAGASVHVWDTKDEGISGPCLVLLHGYLETMYIFNELIDALKGRYRIITMDLPGHGLTDSAPADASGARINSLAFCADVVAGVLQKCGVEKAVLVGHSMGGYVTLQTLRDHPEVAEAALLIPSHPYPDAPEKAADRARECELIRSGKLYALAQASIPKMYYEENLRRCDEKIRETIELCETHDPEGIVSSVEGLRLREDLQDVTAQPPVPLGIIHGDHDAFLPLETVAKMKECFPKLWFRLIPDTGHNPFIENPDAFIEALVSFTKENC